VSVKATEEWRERERWTQRDLSAQHEMSKTMLAVEIGNV
jgi:hypothetical protein